MKPWFETNIRADPRTGRFSGAVRLRGCFVVGCGHRARLLHLPQHTAMQWRHGKARLIAETKCGAVLVRAASHLHAPAALRMCDRCALADFVSHVVYRFYAIDDSLLYIGTTGDFATRLKNHRVGANAAPWWPLVARWTLVAFDDAESARRYEAAAIRAERPEFNIQHNEPHELDVERRRVARQMASLRGRQRQSPPDVCGRGLASPLHKPRVAVGYQVPSTASARLGRDPVFHIGQRSRCSPRPTASGSADKKERTWDWTSPPTAGSSTSASTRRTWP